MLYSIMNNSCIASGKRNVPMQNLSLKQAVALVVSTIIILISLQCEHYTIVRSVDAFSVVSTYNNNNNNNIKNIIHQRRMIDNNNNVYNSQIQQQQQKQQYSTKAIRSKLIIPVLQSSRDDVAVTGQDAKNKSLNNNNDSTTTNTLLDYNKYLVSPVQGMVDNVTGGWGLSYADLSPDDTTTVTGRTFLASNIAYFIAGAILTIQGDIWFGACTELCAIASFNYHYQQLVINNNRKKNTIDSQSNEEFASNSPEVRLALLVDYIFALLSILTALVYVVTNPLTFTGTSDAPLYGIGISFIACVCLGLSWVWEYGKPYMFWHSLWHLFSAYAGYVVGTDHYYNTLPPP
jgi:hypothetical protein